ncbi:MAG: hypothetical protein QM763_05010 [Agriterribacter sp.]
MESGLYSHCLRLPFIRNKIKASGIILMRIKILFISHPQRQCGVHEFGITTAEALKASDLYEFIYVECSDMNELDAAISFYSPSAIIYNYYPSTMPWLRKKIIHTKYRPLNKHIHIPQIGILHEVTQYKADRVTNHLFDYYIAPDPTLLLKNPLVFKTGRLVPEYRNNYPLPKTPTIGSFGFATPNKGFEKIIDAVQAEFDTAIIRFNIPFADFGDSDGSNARRLINECRKKIKKQGINLIASHNFLNREGVIDFLAKNTVNIFLYQDENNRGLSSTTDYAIAAKRPLVVSDSIMFRHLHNLEPSIIYGESTIKEIISQGTDSLKNLEIEWSTENLVWEYNRILNTILKIENKSELTPHISKWKKFKTNVRIILGLQTKEFTWLRNTETVSEDMLSVAKEHQYTPIILPQNTSLNRILDNNARKQYAPAIAKLQELVPLTMAKKIAEANVQQAFVFDTVYRLMPDKKKPKILCVGSYEDTAAMSLKKMGFKIEEIDPVINYYLQEYYTKPGIEKNTYDIIFSTSVIEHDPDDESFIKCIEGLLALNGIAVLTCDYKDGWKPGDAKPDVDARFYTKHDLEKRLLSYIPDCKLIDNNPDWECSNPDFTYLGKYNYTFATFVIEKIK